MATSAFNHGPVRSDWAELLRNIPRLLGHLLALVRCSPLLAFRHLKQRFLKVTPFTRSFKFAHHPGFDIAPVTDPTLRNALPDLSASLAVPRVDCCEPKNFVARLLYPIYWPDSQASQFACFADKYRELPKYVFPEFRF